MPREKTISDQKIEQYRAQLEKMRDRIIDEVDSVVESIRGELHTPGNLSNTPIHLGDDVPDQLDANIEVVQIERGMLTDIQAALERIEQGTYGRCTDCGNPIAPGRLEVIPYAARCIACANKRAAGLWGGPR